jgi:hypothetical protein
MALIAREAVAPVALPREEHPAPEIGGDVLVQGMDLAQFQRFAAAQRKAAQPQAGESDDDARQRAVVEVLPLLLHLCVVAGDGLPVYSPAEWAAFARQHGDRTVLLAEAATRRSGLGDEKKA